MTTARLVCSLVVACSVGLLVPVVSAADAPKTGSQLPATQPAPVSPAPTLTDEERAAGWRLMFDGTSTANWRVLGGDAFPADAWEVANNALRHPPGKGGGKDLAFATHVENFEFSWEWMIPKKNGNSGVKYRVQETKGKSGAYGPEYQMMNDPGTLNKNSTASLYDVLPPANVELKPQGEFNQSRIVVQGNRAEHWLNGVKVLEFEFGGEAFNAGVAKSKFKDSKVWAKEPRGLIVLTNHGDESWFRNLKLRELPAAPTSAAK